MTTTKTTRTKLEEAAAGLVWEIAEAKKSLAAAANAMARRAAEAVAMCDAMLADQPTSTMWAEFAEGDLRAAKEAKARLEALIAKQKLVEWLTKE